MELAASIVLFAAASLIVVAAFYLLRTDRMSWRSQKLVLDVKLPKLGESGSITEAQTHELLEKGVITPYQTWLSTEQAALLLECGAYVDATDGHVGTTAQRGLQSRTEDRANPRLLRRRSQSVGQARIIRYRPSKRSMRPPTYGRPEPVGFAAL
jgi:hypothetical protein